MLVLGRTEGEKVILRIPGIEEEVVISVLEIRGRKAKLGFSAPREIDILREEIKDRKEKEKEHVHDQKDS
ncbi:MAG: carbon storage regulator [Candidatus Hodarchaeales archaeon]